VENDFAEHNNRLRCRKCGLLWQPKHQRRPPLSKCLVEDEEAASTGQISSATGNCRQGLEEANRNRLTPTRNHGKPLTFRRCLRCGEDISDRHGNAKYCIRCTNARSKPFVVACRVDRETYTRIQEYRPISSWLERLIKREVDRN